MKRNPILSILTVCLIFCSQLVHSQTFELEDKLVPDGLESSDHFSHFDGVSIHGKYAVTGSHNSDIEFDVDPDIDNAGEAYLYLFNDTICEWQLIDTIFAQSAVGVFDFDAFSQFGFSASIKDDIIAIGAPTYDTGIVGENGGRVYVYKIVDNEAVFVERLLAIDNAGLDDSQPSANFGADLDWDGQRLIVGAVNENQNDFGVVVANAGAAYIYNWNGFNFDFQTKLTAPVRGLGDSFGFSVSIFANYAAIGCPNEDENEDEMVTMASSGSAYVYAFNMITEEWDFIQKIVAEDRNLADMFGTSVDITQWDLVIGARLEDENESEAVPMSAAGSAYTYNFNGITNLFEFSQKIVASDRAEGDQFGHEVKISDDLIIIGAPRKDIGANDGAGKAYLYQKVAGVWSEIQTFVATLPETEAQFGETLEMDIKRIIIGAPFGDLTAEDIPFVPAKNDVGASYIYDIEIKPVINDIITNQLGACLGQTITLSVDGVLNDAYGWEWYEGSCSGPLLGEGDSLILDLETTTTICARAAGCFDFVLEEDCFCIEVAIDDGNWHQRTTDGQAELGNDVVTDAEGNVYVVGAYSGFAEFNGGDNTTVTADAVAGFSSYFKSYIAKYDNCGNLMWVSYATGDIANDYANGIALRESDNALYVVGEFTNNITMTNGIGDFGIGVGSETLTLGGQHGYVARLNRETGDIYYIESVTSELPFNRLTAITINEVNGEIFVGGETSNGATQEKLFIRKYSATYTGLNTHDWEKKSQFQNGAQINGMDFDEDSPFVDGKGALWITGTLINSLRFIPFPTAYTGAAQADAFVMKMTDYDGGGGGDYYTMNFFKKGNITWNSGYKMIGNDIAIDPATGNAYITGTKQGISEDVFGLSGTDFAFADGNQVGYFLSMRFDGGLPVSPLVEITNPDGPAHSTGISVVIDNGTVYFTGSRIKDIFFDFSDYIGSLILYSGVDGAHLYVAAYDIATGDYNWSTGTVNIPETEISQHLPSAITVDNLGHAFIVGHFQGDMGYIDGTPSSGDMYYTSNGGTLFTMRVDIEGIGEGALESPIVVEDPLSNNSDNLSINQNTASLRKLTNSTTQFILYPNPTTGVSTVALQNFNPDGVYFVNVYGLDGKLILTTTLLNGNVELDLSDFESGTYILEVNGADFNERKLMIKT